MASIRTRLRRRRLIGLAVLAALAGGAAYLVWRPEPDLPVVGMVRSTEIRIAPAVGGQLAAIKVTRGQHVKAGDVLAELGAPELAAAIVQARTAGDVARASRAHVYAGAREEQVAMLAAEMRKAQSRQDYATQQLGRTSQLAHDDFASPAALDQANADADTARADVAEAEANLESAKAGPTREERGIADAQVDAAGTALRVLERRFDKTILRAPSDGIVGVIVAEVGEAVQAGQPVLTIEAVAQPWLSFNVREDRLHGLTLGTKVDLVASGHDGHFAGVVTELLPLGEFAIWQAARAVGDHDRSTLRMRIDPLPDAPALEPGMTVHLLR
ncbi:HlyD family secretion protein [Bradyrhizobium sp. HKCCYLS1011]|uniref:HlyD family secretion protein n=1 Tax=Bradyrhizobium sp. HKCCYLS1011 TaxID=3420733 RepID=UPI003EB7D665